MLELLTGPNASATWSAVAATFAAIAAFLTWLAQVRTLRETFRPEIVLSGWSRETDEDSGEDLIRFTGIKNVGRGTAKQVIVNATAEADDTRLTYVMSSLHLPSLAAGEMATVDCKISIWWKNVPKPVSGTKFLGVSVIAYYWDALQVRHRLKFSTEVAEDPSTFYVQNPLAPGLGLPMVAVRSEPVWRLKVKVFLSRVPVIGRNFREDA